MLAGLMRLDSCLLCVVVICCDWLACRLWSYCCLFCLCLVGVWLRFVLVGWRVYLLFALLLIFCLCRVYCWFAVGGLMTVVGC